MPFKRGSERSQRLPFLWRYVFGHWPDSEDDDRKRSGEEARKRRTWVLSLTIVCFFVVGYVLVYEMGLGPGSRRPAVSAESTGEAVVAYPAHLRRTIEAEIGRVTSFGSSRVRRISFEGRDEAYPVVSVMTDPEDDVLAYATRIFGVLYSDARTQHATVFFSQPSPSGFSWGGLKRVFMAKVSRATFRSHDWDRLQPSELSTVADYVFYAD